MKLFVKILFPLPFGFFRNSLPHLLIFETFLISVVHLNFWKTITRIQSFSFMFTNEQWKCLISFKLFYFSSSCIVYTYILWDAEIFGKNKKLLRAPVSIIPPLPPPHSKIHRSNYFPQKLFDIRYYIIKTSNNSSQNHCSYVKYTKYYLINPQYHITNYS